MLCYHQHLYPMCTKMMCLSVWQVGPWVSPGATSLQGAAWNPLASWILLAPKNWKRGWWQAARKDWLVTCTHRYHLRPVPRAGRGFRTSSVWQERRMRPVEQHTGGGGGTAWLAWGGSLKQDFCTPPPPQTPHSAVSRKTSDCFCCEDPPPIVARSWRCWFLDTN